MFSVYKLDRVVDWSERHGHQINVVKSIQLLGVSSYDFHGHALLLEHVD